MRTGREWRVVFTSSERRLLALLILFLAAGYLLTALRHAGVRVFHDPQDAGGDGAAGLASGSGGEAFDDEPVAAPAAEPGLFLEADEQGDATAPPFDESPLPDPRDPPRSSRHSGPAAGIAADEVPEREVHAGVFVDGFLDLNRADSVSLEALPGIGPALAGRILAARKRAGGFTRIEDLRQVRGIGPQRLRDLSRLVTVVPPKAGRAPAAPDSGRGSRP
jgi:hypothetical protein